MDSIKWHRHFGVYGICCRNGSLLVVHKTSGPYRNRYDLPGGTMGPNETVEQTLIREMREETGMEVHRYTQLGFSEFIVRYTLRDNTHIQHIPLFFRVEDIEMWNEPLGSSDDTSGYGWMDLSNLEDENSSPLVMKAKRTLLANEFVYESSVFDEWVTLEA